MDKFLAFLIRLMVFYPIPTLIIIVLIAFLGIK